jgi:predicted DsbA family dithiol-disulfide isomerase
VISLAAEHGVQDQVLEALMHGYFTDGEPIGDRETIVRLAAGAGLDAERVRAALEAGDRTEEVRTDEALAGRFGIRGVPFFVLDRHYGFSGAQPPEAILAALTQAWEERDETTAAA